jgi:hypothetical protein
MSRELAQRIRTTLKSELRADSLHVEPCRNDPGVIHLSRAEAWAHHLDLTVKHGGGSLMMWGCMSWKGVGYGCQIMDRMDADLYCEVLETTFKDSLEYWEFSADGFIFQQDNDPKHTSKLARSWFQDNGIEILDWPAQSPDLNPIEHLWHHLKLKLAAYETKAKSVRELWERCDREWNRFTAEDSQKYIESMPARVQAVLVAKGGHTRY